MDIRQRAQQALRRTWDAIMPDVDPPPASVEDVGSWLLSYVDTHGEDQEVSAYLDTLDTQTLNTLLNEVSEPIFDYYCH